MWGDGSFLYYVLQFSTFAILILAANTAYADFPRLCSFVARDGFLPRQLANRGDRLVFSNGVLVLSGMAAVLVIIFGGETKALIPLYAVGVFTGFTLSQSGMVVYQWRNRGPRWKVAMTISAIGATATGIVLLVVVVSKFTIGAWLPAVVIPAAGGAAHVDPPPLRPGPGVHRGAARLAAAALHAHGGGARRRPPQGHAERRCSTPARSPPTA